MSVRWLALLPFLGIVVGAAFVNRVTPLVFGMPLALAWQVAWVVLTAVVMGIIYLCDPANREPDPHKDGDQPAQASADNAAERR